MRQRWEYNLLKAPTNNTKALDEALNKLGADGWEVCGFAAPDKTLGLNALVVLLKRPGD